MMMQRATSVMVRPAKVINLSGPVENEVMPSIEKLSILRNGYFDSPAVRAVRS